MRSFPTPIPQPGAAALGRSACEAVRLQVESDICAGVLLPGDALDEDALATRFQLARAPVRKALLELSADGQLTIVPDTGIHVSRPPISQLLGLMELLAELEGACAKLATRRLTPEQIDTLRLMRARNACADGIDARAYSRCNAEFHEFLYTACRNTALTREIARARRRTQVFRRTVFQNPMRIRGSRQEHGRIMDAMLEGDAIGAGELMIEHIWVGGRAFADQLSHAPPQLLSADPEYPGRQAAQDTRLPPPAPVERFELLVDERSVVQGVRRYLKERACEPATLAETATALGLSTRTLTRRLALEGATFQRIKDNLRRDAAIEAIAHSSQSLAQIAHDLGFGDTSAFYRAFRTWTGTTPLAFRSGRTGGQR